MMFCVKVTEIFTSWSPININFFLRTLYVSQWYRISIALDRLCFIVSFNTPNAVEISVRRGLGGRMWPNSVSVTWSGAPLWAL
jgi:hypothetical protein